MHYVKTLFYFEVMKYYYPITSTSISTSTTAASGFKIMTRFCGIRFSTQNLENCNIYLGNLSVDFNHFVFVELIQVFFSELTQNQNFSS